MAHGGACCVLQHGPFSELGTCTSLQAYGLCVHVWGENASNLGNALSVLQSGRQPTSLILDCNHCTCSEVSRNNLPVLTCSCHASASLLRPMSGLRLHACMEFNPMRLAKPDH